MKWVAIGILAALLAIAALLILPLPSEDFWSKSVSFGCSYVAPAFDAVVYTTMFFEKGDYQVVLQDLKSGQVRALSDSKDRTAMHGVSNGKHFLYFALRGNSFVRVTGSISLGEFQEVGFAFNPDDFLRFEDRLLRIRSFPNLTPNGNILTLLDGYDLKLIDLRTRTEEVFGPHGGLGRPWVAQPGTKDDRLIPVEAAVSPDLSRVAVTHLDDDTFSLRVHNRDQDSSAEVVKEQLAIAMRPRWLADGSGLTFIERSDGSWKVMEWKSETSRLKVLYEGTRFVETAELHPDGRHLLLTLGDTSEFAGYFSGLHVHLLDLETGELKQIGV